MCKQHCVKLYIAVRQRYGHDVLRVDLQCPDSLPRTSVFRLHGKLCDEPINAAWEEPGNHNKGMVLSKCCQVGHKSRGWKEGVFKWNHTEIYATTITDVFRNTHQTQLSWYTKTYWRLQLLQKIWLRPVGERQRQTESEKLSVVKRYFMWSLRGLQLTLCPSAVYKLA